MTARTTFVESKQKLAEELQENMKKIDRTRQSICQRKYKAFKIESNGICRNDLNLMRQRAQEVYLAEKTELLGLHPWYNDLLHKVVYCSGAKTAMSKCEAKLLKCIKRCLSVLLLCVSYFKHMPHQTHSNQNHKHHVYSIILDDLEITKPQVVRMMKLVPPGEFMKEDIQKIFRFVKINVGLSDVDYLEAIKQSHEQKE
ncbi:hypothetical protein BKA69DRAFT_1094871 [Paraphysoderma sedebokerense]|nr:hypothetical protein BKA69DRAFT_1094871 [Paraphysoderma sedebokerense]